MGVSLRLQDAMTDIQGIDECGIFMRPMHVANALHPGNSQQFANINQTENYSRSTERSNVTIRYRDNITTDCPRQEQTQSITTRRPLSVTEQDRAALGIINFHGPRHSAFVTEPARLKSFSFWPPSLTQKPPELAEAGFFYTGRSDQVKCFYCDGGLESWEPADSPWGEHVKWFGDCAFVKMKREKENNLKEKIIETGDSTPMGPSVEMKTNKSIKEDEANFITKTNTSEIREPVTGVESTKLKGLQQEVQNLREERSCKICLENEASIVFLPCGHLCSCANCAPALKICAVCRAPIQGLVRTYMV